MISAVVDTNVLISALIGSGNSRKIIRAFSNKKFILVISNELVKEFNLSASKPRLSHRVTDENRTVLDSLIKELAHVVHPKESIVVSRDPKDNIVLETALAGDADFIVTGDKDLLVLKSFQGIPIVTPKIFVASLRGK